MTYLCIKQKNKFTKIICKNNENCYLGINMF